MPAYYTGMARAFQGVRLFRYPTEPPPTQRGLFVTHTGFAAAQGDGPHRPYSPPQRHSLTWLHPHGIIQSVKTVWKSGIIACAITRATRRWPMPDFPAYAVSSDRAAPTPPSLHAPARPRWGRFARRPCPPARPPPAIHSCAAPGVCARWRTFLAPPATSTPCRVASTHSPGVGLVPLRPLGFPLRPPLARWTAAPLRAAACAPLG